MEAKVLKNGMTGSTLKLIAIITMLIDHIAAVVIDGYLRSVGFGNHLNGMLSVNASAPVLHRNMYYIDLVMRLIGRIAFPIFCFLLVEGFFYTKNRFKYALRLFIFAIISEIPFDMALGLSNNFLPEFSYQNVYFTLLFGLLTIWGLDKFKKWYLQVPILLLGILIAYFCHTDYDALGVATIAMIYWYHKKSNVKSMLAGCIVLTLGNLVEATSFVDVYLVHKYNGKRGLNLKYIFYLFYPVHLFILYFILQGILH